MKTVKRSKQVAYETTQMFDLVNDINSYPEFLNWCQGSQIQSSTKNEVIASLEVGYGGFSKRFTTRNLLSRPHKIDMRLVDGPFISLAGGWHFLEQESGCIVEIQLDFEVSRGPMDSLFGIFFEEIVSSQVEAFGKRANYLYG